MVGDLGEMGVEEVAEGRGGDQMRTDLFDNLFVLVKQFSRLHRLIGPHQLEHPPHLTPIHLKPLPRQQPQKAHPLVAHHPHQHPQPHPLPLPPSPPQPLRHQHNQHPLQKHEHFAGHGGLRHQEELVEGGDVGVVGFHDVGLEGGEDGGEFVGVAEVVVEGGEGGDVEEQGGGVGVVFVEEGVERLGGEGGVVVRGVDRWQDHLVVRPRPLLLLPPSYHTLRQRFRLRMFQIRRVHPPLSIPIPTILILSPLHSPNILLGVHLPRERREVEVVGEALVDPSELFRSRDVKSGFREATGELRCELGLVTGLNLLELVELELRRGRLHEDHGLRELANKYKTKERVLVKYNILSNKLFMKTYARSLAFCTDFHDEKEFKVEDVQNKESWIVK